MLGVVLGIGIIVAFVFLGSEETIDAPRLNDAGSPAAEAPVSPGSGGASGEGRGGSARP